MKFLQASFVGGLNFQKDSSKLSAEEYFLLINGRTRKNAVEPIRKPKNLTSSLPPGKKQGLFSAGQYLVVFNSGEAFWKNIDTPEADFKKISDFKMSETEEWLYAEAVPASKINRARYLSTTKSSGSVKLLDNNAYYSTATVNGSVAALIVQDGVNQPRLIFPEGTSRQISTYDQWDNNNREYVPIGKQMLYYDGKLYVVAPDGRKIYHSVTGRPVDFMVIVGSPDTSTIYSSSKLPFNNGGDPANVAHMVDYNTITGIKNINVVDGGFFVSTRYSSYLVYPNKEDLLFGEPTFSNIFLFNTGLQNQNSYVEIHGDTLFVDQDGINSFNSTRQLRYASNNDTISGSIFRLFDGITQHITAVEKFDDYAYFAVNTIYGPAVIVYDMVLKVFTGIDIYSGVGQIKQFCEVRGNTGKKFFFITTDNQLYEMFEGSDVEQVSFISANWCSGDPDIEQKLNKLKLVFADIKSKSGTVTATLYVDNQKDTVLSQDIEGSEIITNGRPYYTIPFGNVTADSTRVVPLDFSPSSHQGWKIALMIQWQFSGILTHIAATSEDILAHQETAALAYTQVMGGRK